MKEKYKNIKDFLIYSVILISIILVTLYTTGCGGGTDSNYHDVNSNNAIGGNTNVGDTTNTPGGNTNDYNNINVVDTTNNSINNVNEEDFCYDYDNDSDSKGEGDDEYPDAVTDDTSNETYENYGVNPEISTEDHNISTFSIDVDTGSYSITRRFIMENNQLPPKESVRPEEFINYFNYHYKLPEKSIFKIRMDVAPSPFRENKYALRIGIQGKDIKPEERKRANLVFLVDISGSMRTTNKLPLIKESLKILLDKLNPDDFVGIAVYAGIAEPYLKSTSVRNKDVIIEAINSLDASGTTNAEGGIKVAYEMISENYIKNGINRVILCSDGDANVGRVSPEELLAIIEQYRTELGITLSTFGFGMGNYNDYFMEQLANNGDGNYAYIDSEEEAQKLFGDKFISLLQVIARDVKIQIEFNKNAINTFRLIGYENRKLKDEDFRNDKVDAGEIGPLHNVTAVYELTLKDSFNLNTDEQLFEFRLRCKDSEGKEVSEVNNVMFKANEIKNNIYDASPYYRFAVNIAEFAEILRGSIYAQNSNFELLMENITRDLAELQEPDPEYTELLEIIEKAFILQGHP